MAAKIAVMNIGAPGHVLPTLAVVEALARAGAQVTHFHTRAWEARIRATGAAFEPYESTFGDAPPGELGASPPRLLQECLHVLPQIERRMKELGPELVIYDRRFLAARILAPLVGAKEAAWCVTFAANAHFSLKKLFNMPGFNLASPPIAGFQADVDQLTGRYGTPRISVATLFDYELPINVVFVHKDFHYAAESFDDRQFAFVGPALPAQRLTGDWDRASAGGRPILLVSLGTVFNAWPEFFKTVFTAFGGSRWHVVMATGKRVDRAALGPAPDHFEVAEHVAQLDVLRHASAFVTHGGMGSTMEALWFGVPMVVVPQIHEHIAIGRRVRDLGIGHLLAEETLDPRTHRPVIARDRVTAAALREAVDAIAENPGVRGRMQTLQRDVRGAGGPERAALYLLESLRH